MIGEVVNKYLKLFPADISKIKPLLEQLKNKEDLADRHNYAGHIAGSGLIFSPDLKKLLLIYHPTFERWMQPGGHLEQDEEGPWITAERESVEETGVKIARRLGESDERIPILIESHWVPTKLPKNEPKHYHHAFWYGFVAESEQLKLEDRVIKKAAWMAFDKIDEPNIQKALSRAKKLLA